MPTETFYPDAHPETSSVDGYVEHGDAAGLTWASIVAGVGTGAGDSGANLIPFNIKCHGDTDKWLQVRRSILVFDTSVLPPNPILSAELTVYGATKDNGFSYNTFSVNIYSAAPNSDTALVAGDFNSIGSTPYCDNPITYPDWAVGASRPPNVFVFNAVGLAAINPNGRTYIAMRNSNYDATGVSPSWEAGGKFCQVVADQADATYSPKLVVTYSTAFPSAEVRVTGIRRIYRPGIYRMQLSLGEVSDMDDMAGVRDYERFRHWWSFEPTMPPPIDIPRGEGGVPFPSDDPERQWRFPPSPVLPPGEVTMPPPVDIPRTGRGAVPFAGDDPERQPLWKPRRKLPFPAPPPSFSPKTILEAPKIFWKSFTSFISGLFGED